MDKVRTWGMVIALLLAWVEAIAGYAQGEMGKAMFWMLVLIYINTFRGIRI